MSILSKLLRLLAIMLFLSTGFAKIPKIYHNAAVVRGRGDAHLKQETVPVEVTCSAKVVPKATLNILDLLLCGAFATVVGDFAMHPVDTIKVFQQASVTKVGIIAAARAIFKAGGIGGLYRGVVPYLIADGSSGALKFATFELSKDFIERRTPAKWHTWTRFACAAAAMLACSVVLIPGEVLKTRLQAGTAAISLSKIVKDIWAQDGIGGFFAGYAATLLRDVPYTMLELGIYENMKLMIKNRSARNEISQGEELFCAAFTGTHFWDASIQLVLIDQPCNLFRGYYWIRHDSFGPCQDKDDDAIDVICRAIQKCV